MRDKSKTSIELIQASIKKNPNQPLTWKNWSFKKTFVGDSWGKFWWWVLIMFLAWSYYHDTQACRETLENIDDICMQWMETQTFLDTYGNDLNTQIEGNGTTYTWEGDQQELPNTISSNS